MVRVTAVLEARLLGESDWIAAAAMCELCRLDLEAVRELAALGVVTPRDTRRPVAAAGDGAAAAADRRAADA